MCFTSYFFNLSERNNDMDLNFNREIYDKKYFRVLESNTFMEEKEYTKVRSFSTMAMHSSHSAGFGNGREIII